jgi:hypothetical protein
VFAELDRPALRPLPTERFELAAVWSRPKSHRAHLEWPPSRMIQWAQTQLSARRPKKRWLLAGAYTGANAYRKSECRSVNSFCRSKQLSLDCCHFAIQQLRTIRIVIQDVVSPSPHRVAARERCVEGF